MKEANLLKKVIKSPDLSAKVVFVFNSLIRFKGVCRSLKTAKVFNTRTGRVGQAKRRELLEKAKQKVEELIEE